MSHMTTTTTTRTQSATTKGTRASTGKATTPAKSTGTNTNPRTGKANTDQVSVDRQKSGKAPFTVQVRDLETLVANWQEHTTLAGRYSGTIAEAKAGLAVAQVYQARSAYLTATHPEVLTARTKKAGVNAVGAATVLGIARTTLLPYIAAGEALKKAKLINNTGAPTSQELTIVDNAIEKAARAGRRASNKRTGNKGKPVVETADANGNTVETQADSNDVQMGVTFDTAKGKIRELTSTLEVLTKVSGPLSAEQHAELVELLGLVTAAFSPAE